MTEIELPRGDGRNAEQEREKVNKLRIRIKNTSSVRFGSSRRVRTDYNFANLTVVVLSLWAIFISYILATNLANTWHFDRSILDTAGVILPVFIVVFSLLEGGENYLRSYQLEMNARQLRELSDQLYAASAPEELGAAELINIFKEFSQRYGDSLERTPVNHDDLDHFHRLYSEARKQARKDKKRRDWWRSSAALFFVWTKCQLKRCLYIAFWFAPAALFVIARK